MESEILDGTGRLAGTLRTEVEAYWRAGLDLGLSGLEFERQELERLADTVLELGRYAVAMHGSTETRRERGSYLVLHTQTADGSWQRAVEVYSQDEPAPARRDRGKEER